MDGFFIIGHLDIFCTESTALPDLAYWAIDLGRTVKIDKVVLICPFPNIGNGNYYLRDINIRLGSSSNITDNTIIASFENNPEPEIPFSLISDSSVEGNVFSVETETETYLCFAEIQIILH